MSLFYPIFPLKSRPLMPKTFSLFSATHVEEKNFIEDFLSKGFSANTEVIFSLQKENKYNMENQDQEKKKNFFSVGTLGKILYISPLVHGNYKILVQGSWGFSLDTVNCHHNIYEGSGERILPVISNEDRCKALKNVIFKGLQDYIEDIKPEERSLLKVFLKNHEHTTLEDFLFLLSALLPLSSSQLYGILKSKTLDESLEGLFHFLQSSLRQISFEKSLLQALKQRVKQQQEGEIFFLKKETPQGPGEKNLEPYENFLKRQDVGKKVKKAFEEKLRHYENTMEHSSERGNLKRWLDFVLELPFGECFAPISLDMQHVKDIMDEDLEGLKKVKNAILRFQATQIRRYKWEEAEKEKRNHEKENHGNIEEKVEPYSTNLHNTLNSSSSFTTTEDENHKNPSEHNNGNNENNENNENDENDELQNHSNNKELLDFFLKWTFSKAGEKNPQGYNKDDETKDEEYIYEDDDCIPGPQEEGKKDTGENLSGKKEGKGPPILVLCGPPGTGKTALVKAIARALNLPLELISLAGKGDPSYLQGHGYTYVGSTWGAFANAMKNSGVRNPILFLDEVDKFSPHHNQGSIENVLVAAMDPEQNTEFIDQYLNFPLDLSEAFFICTANSMDIFQGPLRSRMEVIWVPSYTLKEKHTIALHRLWDKALEENFLPPKALSITPQAMEAMIEGGPQEGGVRKIKQMIRGLISQWALENQEGKKNPSVITLRNLYGFMKKAGYPLRHRPLPLQRDTQGLAMGLAWTSVGGDVMPLESIIVPQEGALKLTGRLGDVMKESAQLALSWSLVQGRYHYDYLMNMLLKQKNNILENHHSNDAQGDVAVKMSKKKTPKNLHKETEGITHEGGNTSFSSGHNDLWKKTLDNIPEVIRKQWETPNGKPAFHWHIHAPEGAVPKDGPSAGVTITLSLMSWYLGLSIKGDIAMTGEIDLLGNVMPVGGIREKVVAAYNKGMKTVLLPGPNVQDLDDIPQDVRKNLRIVFVHHLFDVLSEGLKDYKEIYGELQNEQEGKSREEIWKKTYGLN